MNFIIMKSYNQDLAQSLYGHIIGFCDDIAALETMLTEKENTKLIWKGKGIIDEPVQASNGFYYVLIPVQHNQLVAVR